MIKPVMWKFPRCGKECMGCGRKVTIAVPYVLCGTCKLTAMRTCANQNVTHADQSVAANLRQAIYVRKIGVDELATSYGYDIRQVRDRLGGREPIPYVDLQVYCVTLCVDLPKVCELGVIDFMNYLQERR